MSEPFDPGNAGASARREYERRVAKRERRLEREWGRFAGIAKFVSSEPQSTRAYAKGAEGEVRIAQLLEKAAGHELVFLHDRAVPGTRGNIDHIAVGDSSVWVIDAKAWSGRVEERSVGGFYSGSNRLYVSGRDRHKSVEGMDWQVEAVTKALAWVEWPVTIRPILCIDAEWRLLFAEPLRFGDVFVMWPKGLGKMLASHKTTNPDRRDEIATRLSAALPEKR